MAGRKKGTPKTGGRKKGTPNKMPSSVRAAITSMLEKYFQPIDDLAAIIAAADDDNPPTPNYEVDLLLLDPKDRLTLMERFSAYVVPKMQATTVDINAADIELTIEDTLLKLSKENDL